MKKVILVDDEKLVAEAIRRQVDWESCGAVLCRVCLNAFEALKAVEEVRPDIIITDIKMPVMDGLELVRRAGRQYAQTGQIDTALLAEIGSPMIPEELYAKIVNGTAE